MPYRSTTLLNIDNTINRFTLDLLKDSIYIREMIEGTLGCLLSWSRVSPREFTVIHYEGLVKWEHRIVQISSSVHSTDVFHLVSYRENVCTFDKRSDAVGDITYLWDVIDSYYRPLTLNGRIGRCSTSHRAARVNESENEYMDLAHENQRFLDLTDSFTITSLIRLDENSKDRNLIKKGTNYRIYYSYSDNKMKFELGTTGGIETLTSVDEVTLYEWFLVIATYDNTTDAGNPKMTFSINNLNIVENDNLQPLEANEDDIEVGKGWEGLIDKTIIYKGNLDEYYIEALVNGGQQIGYSTMPGCLKILAFWEMNEEVGIRYDSGPFYNHLQSYSDNDFFGLTWSQGVGAYI